MKVGPFFFCLFVWFAALELTRSAALVTISSLVPNHGPEGNPVRDTAKLVTVVGANFQANSRLSCRFGSVVVHATFASATKVTCLAPPRSATSVLVDVSNNNQDFTVSALAYTYQRMIFIHVAGEGIDTHTWQWHWASPFFGRTAGRR
jgi:hypothetical protein